METLQKSKFAILCGVSAAAVTKAVKEGRIVIENGVVPIQHATNIEFRRSAKERKRLQKRSAKDEVERVKRELAEADADASLSTDTGVEESVKAATKPKGGHSKNDADVARIRAQTAKLHLELAQEVKALIPKKSVDKLFGAIYAAMTNYILPQGQRTAPEICDRLGVTDTEKVLEIQEYIDDENEKTVQEIKRICKMAIGKG